MWIIRIRRQANACPFGQHFWLDMPRPFLRQRSLVEMLQPRPAERILEIGPGTGYYSLDVARRLAPRGQLDVLDIQQEMLDELYGRRIAAGIDNLNEMQGDASQLPYSDATFDAAFLVATLGEVPNKAEAVRELRRVLKPQGRLVVGEGQPDPHMVTQATLQALAEDAGLRHVRTSGFPFGYFARFSVGPGTE